MTIVKVRKNQIEVIGHTNYAEAGKDIVCAAISSIITTSINAIVRIDEASIKYTKDDAYIKIELLKNNKIINILTENMISELKSLAKQYNKNIKIEEVS